MPKVTVMVMIYNSAPYLPGCLDSLRAQSFGDFEVLMVDDASTDESAAICSRYARSDTRFRLIRHEQNRGLSRCRAESLREARGEYTAVLDSDDLARPDRLEKQVALLDQQRETVLTGSHFKNIDWNGRILGITTRSPLDDATIRLSIAFGNCLAHSTVMFRTKEAVACGGYNPEIIGGEDMDLYSRLLTLGRAQVIPEVLSYWRSHDINKSKIEPQKVRNIYKTLVRLAILRHLGCKVSDTVAGAVVDTYILPASSLDVFREAAALVASSPWLLRGYRGEPLTVTKSLKQCALLGLLRLRRRNAGETWWPDADACWQSWVKALSVRDKNYFWFSDIGLFRPRRLVGKKELIPLAKALLASPAELKGGNEQ